MCPALAALSQYPEGFAPPSGPGPRGRYSTTTNRLFADDGITPAGLKVLVTGPEGRAVAEYVRRYSCMYSTFEPFRWWRAGSGWSDMALVSVDYTRTAVLDLQSGELVAEEAESYYDEGRTQSGAGFCPVDFYVPDWADVYRHGQQGPLSGGPCLRGAFGFVSGCYWGDDGSWKVQFLDLSGLDAGVVRRDDRFGYLELPNKIALADAISVSPFRDEVQIAVAIGFNLADGAPGQESWDGLCDPDWRQFQR